VEGSRIAAIGGAELFGKAARELDAKGKYVMPGIIDPHTHIQAPFQGCQGALDFYNGSVAGAFGGVTSFIDFANYHQGVSALQSVKDRLEEMEVCAIDHSVHAKLVDSGPENIAAIRELAEFGVTSIKMFMTYRKEGVMADDRTLLKVMEEAKKWGVLPGVHAESNTIAELNIERAQAAGTLGWSYFAETKPVACEIEALQRVILFAEYTGCPLYIFHLTSGPGLAKVVEAQRKGLRILAETCPHYLVLTKEKYETEKGYLYMLSPPLREDGDREALWRGLAEGSLCNIGSDEASFSVEEKEMHLDRDARGRIVPDFTKVVNGGPGIEERLGLLLAEGVNRGRISLNKLCEVTSYNPARVFGLYPEKGLIQVGSDADIVIVDPEKAGLISPDMLHHHIDYSLYAGTPFKGWPVTTILRGQVIVENGEFTGKRGGGKYVARHRGLI
jgi:dihydropyrimidinase